MLEFTKTDLARLETTIKALKRGKYELEGEEVLAFAQAFSWLTQTFERIREDIATPKVTEEPKAVKKK